MMYTISRSGHDYIIARGWRRYGVEVNGSIKSIDHLPLPILQRHSNPKVPSSKVKIFNIFENWRVLFHGTRPGVLASILSEGHLMKAGDTLITGEKLKSVNSNGRQKDGVGVEYSHVVYHYLPITQPLYDILLAGTLTLSF